MRPTAATVNTPPPPIPTISGKWLIIGVLLVALVGAGGSWWFRYSSTHKAAKFWGAQHARLIRDAPIVELYEARKLSDSELRALAAGNSIDTSVGHDISRARGLAHLRNAFIDDRSFHWPPEKMRPGSWGWVLVFRETPKGRAAPILITADWKFVDSPSHDYLLSCEPISAGLAVVLTEFSSAATPR